MTDAEQHAAWMERALGLARQAWGATHPNPLVGALIVEDGAVVAEGFHARAGGPHAEIEALRALGRRPKPGATLVVTLEPCSTQGRTPPCTRAILEAGFRRVIVGATDPNPLHAGRGLTILRDAGVEVVDGVLTDYCEDLNLIFNHWITDGRPLLAGKIATSLDGRTAARTGASRWITGEAARADVHRWRRLFPAIAVGAGTVVADDPALTARLPEGAWCPVRLVLDVNLRTAQRDPLPRVYADADRARTVVVCGEHAGAGYARRLRGLGVGVWSLPAPDGRLAWSDILLRCGAEGLAGVLLEGGARALSLALAQRALSYLFHYTAPLVFADDRAPAFARGLRVGSPAEAVRLAGVRRASFGDDALVRGRLVYPDSWHVDDVRPGHG